MKAARHPHEAARVAALRSYDILDTPRESDYDDVADIARRICGTAVGVVNLIDADRQWFKAEIGIGARETPLDTSICAHVILAGDYVEIGDTQADDRLCDNPLCIGDNAFRFYAGATLRTADGLPIGTVCVLDYAPRQLDDLQRDTLRLLATQVMRQFELRALVAQAAMLRREIDHRVKNSLHSVAAFAQLRRRAAGPEAEATLRAVEQQIGAVALLHDLISEAGAERIDLTDYLGRLTALLAAIVPANVAVDGAFEPFVAAPAVATALGAIVNELVANAIKHSFAGGDPGRIVLSGENDGDGGYRIVCSDDGAGSAAAAPSPPPMTTARTGLGLQIMAAAIRQLRGTVAGGRSDAGYRSVVAFPRPAP